MARSWSTGNRLVDRASGFSTHGEDDFAQPAVVNEYVKLRFKSAWLNDFEFTDEFVYGLRRDLERWFALRTEAAVEVSAWSKTDDADRAEAGVAKLEGRFAQLSAHYEQPQFRLGGEKEGSCCLHLALIPDPYGAWNGQYSEQLRNAQ
jgi:hypothetical protein